MITINGKKVEAIGITLTEYLLSADYQTDRIAVELNGEILPKSKYGTTTLSEGDKVEIVSFVGGG